MLSFRSPNLENMGRGRLASGQSLHKKAPLLKVQILIVDDDSTSLAIVSAMLKTCSLQDHMIELSVVTVKDPIEALTILRVKNGVFDLVVTDLLMPRMNGFELQKQVNEEFKIPVIIMSSDDNESVISKSLENGALLYMVKPVKQQDVKNAWQYAVAAKKGKAVVIEELGSNEEEETSSNDDKISFEEEDVNSASSVLNEESSQKRKKGRKRARDNDQEEEEEDAPAAPKKAKVVWTNSLHNRFLQAINHIGLEKAVPKRILEFMNVPGLTRENVASHLQKYRMFLKKVAERGLWSLQNPSDRTCRSSFANGYSSMFKAAHQDYSMFLGQQQFMRPTFHPGHGGNFPGLGSSSYGFSRFPNLQLEASSSNSAPQFCYGQSSLFGNPNSSFQQRPMFGYNPNSLQQLNNSICGLNLSPNRVNNYGLMNPANGFTSTGGATPMLMYQQQNQASPTNLHNNGTTPMFTFGSTGIGCSSSNYPSGIGNMGTTNPHFSNPLNPASNYAGIRLTSDGEIIGSGQLKFKGKGLSTGFNTNWTSNKNINSASTSSSGNGMFNGIFGASTPSSGNGMFNGIFGAPTPSSGNGIFGYLGTQGRSSAAVGFGNVNPFSPTFTTGNPENTSVLPPVSTRQHTDHTGILANVGRENNFDFNIMNDAAPTSDNISNTENELGEGDLNELLFGPTNITTFNYQQQDVEGVLSINFPGSSYHADQVNSAANELLNVEFSNSCTIADKATWNEHPSGQLQGREQIVNPNFGGNVNSANGYCPSFDQQQFNNNEKPMDSHELNSMHLDKTTSDNQEWGEDFLDFLLGNEPY